MKENNKLLAEFLGWLVMERYVTPTDESITSLKLNSEFKEIPPYTMKFHNDWNWLMEVVEKIENSETKDGRTFTIGMHRDSVFIFEYGLTTNEIVFTEGEGRFENLYNACVEFVEWLNKEEFQKAVMNSIDLE